MLKRHLMTAYSMTPEQVPGEVGTGARLSDGGTELCRETPGACQGDRAWSQAGARPDARTEIQTRQTVLRAPSRSASRRGDRIAVRRRRIVADPRLRRRDLGRAARQHRADTGVRVGGDVGAAGHGGGPRLRRPRTLLTTGNLAFEGAGHLGAPWRAGWSRPSRRDSAGTSTSLWAPPSAGGGSLPATRSRRPPSRWLGRTEFERTAWEEDWRVTPGEVGGWSWSRRGCAAPARRHGADCARLEDGRWSRPPGRRPQPAPEGARTSATGVPLDAVRRRPRRDRRGSRQPIRLAPD